MVKRLTLVIALLFVCGFVSAFSGAGAGTSASPFQITNWTTLNEVRNNLTANYILMDNLSLATANYTGIGSAWVPVGTDSSAFAGNFNGNNKTISDLVISRSGLSYVGLFGYTTGNVSDANLINITVIGRHYVGALVGAQNGGNINHSSVSGTINADGASNLYIGGLVGRLIAGVITNSSSSVSVTGVSPSNSGGLVGYQDAGTITNSYATGNVTTGSNIGGLVGYQNAGTITNSYATGNVDKGSIATSGWLGGLVGISKGTINSSYATGNVNGYSYVGGLVGYQITGTITNSYATGNVTTANDYSGGLVGYQETTTSITNSFALGNVVAPYNGHAGGLVGIYYGSLINNSYARGNVSAGGQIGGLVGGQWAAGTISYSYSTGNVTLTSGASVGGFMGYKSAGTFTSCYWDNQTSGQATSAGGAGVVGKTTLLMKNQTTFSDWDFAGAWGINSETNNGYPYLLWQPSSGGVVTQNISDCANLTTANSIYVLTANVTSAGTCFRIQANNITLDGNGYKLNYTSGSGITISSYNLSTVKNFIIVGNSSSSTAISLSTAYNNTIQSNNITQVAQTAAVAMTTGAYNQFLNNTITTTNTYGSGFSFNGGSNNTLSGNIITTASVAAYGFIFLNSNGNNLTSNQVNSSLSSSYLFSGTTASHFTHYIDSTNLAEGKPVNYTNGANNIIIDGVDYSAYGQVIFANSINLTVKNSNFINDSLSVYNITSSLFQGNNMSSSSNFGFQVYNSQYNTFYLNRIYTGGSYGYGLHIASSPSNNFTSNFVNTTGYGARGVNVASGSNSNIYAGNNISTRAGSSYAWRIESASSHNIFTNNLITTVASDSHGLMFSAASTNNTFSGMDIRTGYYPIYVETAQNFTMTDSIINSSVANFFIVSSVGSGTWNLTNVTRPDGTNINISWGSGANGTLNNFWWANNYVNYTNSSSASGIVVTAYNNYSVQVNNTLGRSDSGLVSYLNFESGNSTTTFDYMSRNNGTYGGGMSSNVSGILGNASRFDGSNDFINLSYQTINLSRVTYSAWVNMANFSGAQYVLGNRVGATNDGLIIYSTTTNLYVWYNGVATTSSALPNLNTWAHVAGAYNGTHTLIYLNGVLIDYDVVAALDSASRVTVLGSAVAGTSAFFNGSIDEVRIYNRSLSAPEIFALYAEGLVMNFTNTTDSSGNAKIALPEYFRGGIGGATTTYFSNYTINATTNYYPETSSWNMSTNRNPYFTLDANASMANLVSPQNNTYSNNASNNFTVNVSDVGEGIKNATLNVVDTLNNWGSFDGDNDVVTSSITLPTNGNISIFGWILTKNNAVEKNFWKVPGFNYIGVYSNGNYYYWDSKCIGSQIDNFGAIPNNVWKFVGFTYASNTSGTYGNLTTYVSGVQGGSGLCNISITGTSFNLGQGSSTKYWNGSIDEVRIYNRSLSASEISQLYYSGLRMNASINNSGLVAWYDFESPSNATRLVDKANGLNNGTITGMTYANSYTSTTSFASPGTLTATVGIVITLVDSIYNWFYSIFDWAGNNVITANQTLTVDTVYPNGFSFYAPLNNSFFNTTSVLFNVSSADSPNASIIPNIDGSLVSWWRMDDNASTTVIDYMGRNNGTANGGASQVTNGKFGKAESFDGVNDNISVTNSASLQPNDMTLSAWIYPKNIAANQVGVIEKRAGGDGSADYNLDVYGNRVRFILGNGAAAVISSSAVASIQNNNWYHIVGIINGTNMQTYVNGLASGSPTTFTGTRQHGSENLGIGMLFNGDTGFVFNGSIDDVMIFNRSLSSDEILSLYNATAYQHTEILSTQGNHTFKSYVQDFAGNINQTGLVNYNIDTVFPTISADAPLNNIYSNSASSNFSATATDTANNVSIFMDIDNSLVSWWRMDDLNATGGIVDYMGRNNATNYGGVTQVSNGKNGRATSFAGTWTSQLNLGTSTGLDFGENNFSISVWLKTSSVMPTWATVVGKGNPIGAIPSFALFSNPTQATFRVRNGTTLNEKVSTSFTAGEWVHVVALRYSNNTNDFADVYVNGVKSGLTSTTTKINVTTSTAMAIGFVQTNYNGSMDDLMIFNRTLGADEIASLYANSSTKYLNATINGLSDGMHNYKVYTQDLAGNVNSTATRTLNVDLTNPAVSFVSPTENNATYFNRTWIYANVSSGDANNLTSTVVNFDNSLVSWWRMDDTNSTGTLVQDYMGRNNGTAINGAAQNISGKFGKSWSFDGTDDYVNVVDSQSLNMTNKLTILAWINPKNITGYDGVIVDKNTYSAVEGGYNFFTYSTRKLYFSYGNGTALPPATTSSNVIVNLNEWQQVAVTVNINSSGVANVSFFRNGVLNSSHLTYNGFISTGNENLYIGRYQTGLTKYFNGSIDDVMIFNRSLSSAEISALYNSTANQYANNFTGLSEGVHTFKAYTQDIAGNVNTTDLMTQTLDRTAANGTLLTPQNDTYSNSTSFNLTANLSDNIGIANATLNVYNETGLFWQQDVAGFGAGKALSFDGMNDKIDTGSDFMGVGDDSVCAWINPIGWGGISGFLYGRIIDNTKTVFYIDGTAGREYLALASDGTNLATTPVSSILLNRWQFVCAIRNSTGNTNMYINGVLSGTANQNSGIPVAGTSNVIIGSRDADNNRVFNGSIDEVQIWNRSLNASEISQLYNSGVGLYANTSVAPFNSGLVSAWHFDNNSLIGDNSTYFVDVTGLNNGTCTTTSCPSYVTGKVLDPASITFNVNTLTATVGIVVNLVEGIYNWFYSLFDWAGNSFNTQNNTLTIDTTYPLINFSSLNPTNGTGSDNAFNITVLINETNIANVSVYFNSTNYVYDFEDNASYFANISEDLLQWNFSAEFGPLGPTEQIYYNVTITDGAGQENSTETRLITGNQPPVINSVVQNESASSLLDPNYVISVNVNITDTQNNFDSAWIELHNSTGNLIDLIMLENQTEETGDIILNNTLTLPIIEGNYTYRIVANDTIGAESYSINYTIADFWDCTWEISPLDLGPTAGWGTNKYIGNLSILNTGDINYTNNNCTITFKLSHNLGEQRIYFDNDEFSTIYTLSANSNITINVNASFSRPSSIVQENLILGVRDYYGRSDTSRVNVTALLVTNKDGPYLVNTITSSPVNVNLTNSNISITAYTKNIMGDNLAPNENNTAYNVSLAWTLPSGLTNLSGSLEQSFENISDLNQHQADMLLGFSDLSSFVPGINNFTLTATGYNVSGEVIQNADGANYTSQSVQINFICYAPSDGVYVTACGTLDGDYTVPSSETTGSSGSGGGGGGGGGSFAKSEGVFELVRGQNQEFELVLDNKLEFEKSKIKIAVTGNNSQYVSVDPKVIDYLGPKSSSKIKVKITAPSYFTSGEFLLQFEFKGFIEGNTSTPFTEVKYITLLILEMPRKDADKLVNDSENILNKMNSSGFYLKDVQDILGGMQQGYANLQFNNLKDANKKINEIYTAATESVKLIEEVNASIIEAERNGVSVSETKKLLYLAQIIFNRGDYINAYAKLKEAKTSLLLETKGEFNLMYAIKNNPIESLGILISVSLVGLGSGYLIRLGLLKRKLRILGEEEVLLLQLMRVVQRDCFDGNKMSMEEYDEAMMQYEKRLGAVIQDKIRTETQIANINKISGKKSALEQERDRLVVLVKQTQDDYMNKGKLDTRIYENMLRTYASRLSKIQEELAYMQAEDELKRIGGFWSSLFRR